MARCAVTAREFGGDGVPAEAALGEQHGEVKDEVGRLAGQRGVVLGQRGDDRFGRFLAELLEPAKPRRGNRRREPVAA